MEITSPVRRAIRLLQVLVDHGSDMTVQELARELDLAPSTVHRLLTLLQVDDMVRKDERLRRYGIGREFYRLGTRVHSQIDPLDIARPVLESLTRETGTVSLLGWYLPADRRFSFVATGDPGHPLTYRIELNTALHLLRGAAGKVILAHLSDDVFLQVLAEAEKYSVDPESPELAQQLDHVHKEGYLTTRNERLPGATGIAAPVFGVDDSVVGSVCTVLTTEHEEHGSPTGVELSVREHAQRLSHLLGASGPFPPSTTR